MRLAEKYARACNPGRSTILGRRLQVFTAAHAELLDRVEYDASAVSPPALLAAVRVCSLPRLEAAAYVERGGKFLADAAWLILFRLDPQIFARAAAGFQSYVDAARELPGYWADDKETRVSTCPPLLMMVRDIAHHFSHTEEEVLDMPLGQAEWKRLAILEAAGVLDFKTDEDDQVIAQAARMAQEFAARGGKWE